MMTWTKKLRQARFLNREGLFPVHRLSGHWKRGLPKTSNPVGRITVWAGSAPALAAGRLAGVIVRLESSLSDHWSRTSGFPPSVH